MTQSVAMDVVECSSTDEGEEEEVKPVLYKQGAEAKLYTYELHGRACIVKERFSKSYRHPDLDARLTRDRLKAEVRTLLRCRQLGIHAPTLFYVEKRRSAIYMQRMTNAHTVRHLIDRLLSRTQDDVTASLCATISHHIGATLATMHKNHLIHGDLTSSNIMVHNDAVVDALHEGQEAEVTMETANSWSPDLIMIDFGLSSVSELAEHKGVDLYVLERALLSAHLNADQLFASIMRSYTEGYGNAKQVKTVVKKLDDVRARGRKREMTG